MSAPDASGQRKILYDGAAKRFTGPRILAASSPTLESDFVANVSVGTTGSGKEQGFRAMQLALTDRIADGTNAGFLRPGARLAVIIVSDEDDCSDPASPPAVLFSASGADACHSDDAQGKLRPVKDYVDAVSAPLAGERRDVVVAVIAGVDPQTKQPAQPTCNASGYRGTRYTAFADAFGAEALVDDVCRPDFSSTLESIANLIAQQITLSEAPADPRLLTISVARANGPGSDGSISGKT
jgi:hypothetical protein